MWLTTTTTTKVIMNGIIVFKFIVCCIIIIIVVCGIITFICYNMKKGWHLTTIEVTEQGVWVLRVISV